MKTPSTAVFSALVWAVTGLGGPASAQGQRLKAETEHFVIHWDADRVRPAAVELARQRAEEAYEKLSRFLGKDKVGSRKAVILLEGPAIGPDGIYRVPHVDSFGLIHLYRYGDDIRSYFSPLPHELVHVYRRGLRRSMGWDPFLEEGFASYVSDQVEPLNWGFPHYGHSLTLVAGQWLARQEAIPLRTLWQDHRRLNLPCKAQSYPLRASFFRFLHDRFGKEAVMRLAYGGHRHSMPLYREIFEQDFEDLTTEWKRDLLERLSSMKDHAQKARAYRTQTPVAGWKVCRSGQEF